MGAEEYTNDIIGHVFCHSPHLHGTIDVPGEVSAGQTLSVTVTLSYDSVVPPPGKDISRFKPLRPRAYVNYPERWLTVTGIDKPDEAGDLKGHDEDAEGGGVPFVQAYCTHCGDGDCRGKENPCNCPEDCGPYCGNWICEAGENRSNCPSDC